MIRFSINGKNYQKPSEWSEIDVATFQRLAHLENDYTDLVGLMAALMGIPKKELSNTKADLTSQTREALKLVANEAPLWEEILHKDMFLYKETYYKVPKDLSLARFGQKVLLQNRLTNNNPADCIAYAVALYIQPLIDKTFDEEKIDALEEEILKLPAIEVYPLANFFLDKLLLFKLLGSKGFNPYQ